MSKFIVGDIVKTLSAAKYLEDTHPAGMVGTIQERSPHHLTFDYRVLFDDKNDALYYENQLELQLTDKEELERKIEELKTELQEAETRLIRLNTPFSIGDKVKLISQGDISSENTPVGTIGIVKLVNHLCSGVSMAEFPDYSQDYLRIITWNFNNNWVKKC